MVGSTARLRCSLAVDSPNVKVEWLHNGNPIRHKRAFVHEGQTCIFQIKPVELSDTGNYSCHVTVDKGTTVVSSARLKVIGKYLQLASHSVYIFKIDFVTIFDMSPPSGTRCS